MWLSYIYLCFRKEWRVSRFCPATRFNYSLNVLHVIQMLFTLQRSKPKHKTCEALKYVATHCHKQEHLKSIIFPANSTRKFLQLCGIVDDCQVAEKPRITTYEHPACGSRAVKPLDLSWDMSQEGPVWDFTPFELKLGWDGWEVDGFWSFDFRGQYFGAIWVRVKKKSPSLVNCQKPWVSESFWDAFSSDQCFNNMSEDKTRRFTKVFSRRHVFFPQMESPRKSIMREGHAADFGFTADELAKRACFEFETWLPRVLSWHDYQYRCFWFFGGKDTSEKNRTDGSGASKSFFSSDAEAAWRVKVLLAFVRTDLNVLKVHKTRIWWCIDTLNPKYVHVMYPFRILFAYPKSSDCVISGLQGEMRVSAWKWAIC